MAKKKWLQEARKRMEEKGTVGAFTEYCKRKGQKGVTANRMGNSRMVGGVLWL